jgi:hypothetical protein
LQVFSQKEGYALIGKQWDLDYISRTGEWRLQDLGKNSEMRQLISQGHGTIVVWRNLDRITKGTKKDNPDDQNNFYREIDHIRDHLSVVFHRYLGQVNGLTILINGRKISAWDPFMSDESTSQFLTEENIPYKGSSVTVRPYVLPHHSELSSDKHKTGAGVAGWNMQQGFYVYRNRRLLVAGDWLGLGFQKEEHYKLARIQLDIPNTMDDEWRIDIKKSHALPPQAIRKDLKRLAQAARQRASEVYRHRAKVLTRSAPSSINFVWKRGELNGVPTYRINRGHPVIESLLSDKEQKRTILSLLKLIDETLPVAGIVSDWREKPEDETTEIVRQKKMHEVTALADEMVSVLIANGKTMDQAILLLENVEPFNEHPEIVEALKDRK